MALIMMASLWKKQPEQKMHEIGRYFVDALGGLFSVISKDLVLDIEISSRDQNFKKFLSEYTVSKIYGDMWNTLVKDNKCQIKFNSLRCCTGRDFVFEINFPKKKMTSIEDIERFINIFKETSLIHYLLSENEEMNQLQQEIDENVEFHYLRVNAVESIQQALKYTQEQDYEKVKYILKDAKGKLQKCSANNICKLQLVNKELQDSYNNSYQKSYQCLPQMQYAQQWIIEQQANPYEEDQYDSYQADMQLVLSKRKRQQIC